MCAAGASAGTANTVTIADVTMQPGTVQDVPIRLLGSTGVGGVTVTLTFSQAIANVTSAVAGDFNIFYNDRSDVGNGILSVTCTKSGQDLTGDLVIATITLGAVGSGSCKLGLHAELTDKSGVAVPSSVDNGTLTVGSAAITDNVTNDNASDGGDSPAASTPTAAPTSRSASTGTLAATTTTTTTTATATATTAAKTAAPVAIAAATTQAATTETTTAPAAGSAETMPEKPETTGLPGFEGAIAIGGLLAIGYVMMWQKR